MTKQHQHAFLALSFKNLFLIVCIIYSSGAITFYSSSWGYGILILISSLLIFKHTFNTKLVKAILIWLLYCLILYLYYGDLELTFNHFVRYSTLIFVSYTLIKLYNYSLFYRFEKTVISLAKISLLFWLWTIINPSSLLNVASTFHIGNSANNPDRKTEFYYMIVYSVESFSSESTHIPRNYGFCLEPVIFACFLVFALFFNLMRHGGLKIKSNLNFWILFITLCTTLSTTGITTLMVFISYYYLSKSQLGIKKYILFVPIITVFVISFIYLDFLFPKMHQEFKGLSNFDKISQMSNQDMRFSAGRFGGFIIGWNDFASNPILGIGPNGMRSYAHKGGASLMNTNGFAGIMSLFGLFGIIAYFFFATKTSICISSFFYNKVNFGFLIIFTFLLMGAGLYVSVIFFSLLTFGYFNTTYRIKYKNP